MKHIILFVLIVLLSTFLVGCGSTKYVPTYIYVADTTKSNTNDSTLEKRFVSAYEQLLLLQKEKSEKKIKESIHEKDSVSPIYDKEGNKTGENHYHSSVKIIESSEVSTLKEEISHLQTYKDSINIFKQKIDSLQNIKNKNIPYYIEKKLNGVQKSLMALGALFLLIVLIMLCAIIKNYTRR